MQTFDFNIFDKEYAPGSDLIAEGHHQAIINVSEIRPTKKNKEGIDNSKYLYLEFTITSNEGFKGRKVFEYLNIHNSSEACQKNARRKLQELAVSVGISDPKNPRDLVNRAVLLDIGIEKQDGSPPRNRAYKFMEIVKQELPSSEPAKENKGDEFKDDIPF